MRDERASEKARVAHHVERQTGQQVVGVESVDLEGEEDCRVYAVRTHFAQWWVVTRPLQAYSADQSITAEMVRDHHIARVRRGDASPNVRAEIERQLGHQHFVLSLTEESEDGHRAWLGMDFTRPRSIIVAEAPDGSVRSQLRIRSAPGDWDDT